MNNHLYFDYRLLHVELYIHELSILKVIIFPQLMEQKDRFTHPMSDGWGLATDGKILYATDGTSTLYHLDPQTLKGLQ